MSEKVKNLLLNILSVYYRPKKYGYSMYSILGPVSTIIWELRRSPIDNLNVDAIAGRVYRQVQQVNKDNFVPNGGAKAIKEAVEETAKELENLNRRTAKKYLEDLRYAVFLQRVIQINELIKKKSTKVEKKGEN